MVSHVEMAPAAAGAASGFKLFGKVITRASKSPDGGAPAASRQQQQQATHAFPSGRASVEQLEEAARARAAAAESRLPCPRCRSEDTKFCYFNNYNVNQPRHFCRACHRYWTAGGAIRNVPVGSGRRKNRPAPPHVTASGSLSAAEYHRLMAGSMSSPAPGLTVAFPSPDHHGWSSRAADAAAATSPPANYTGHGEMEQCWWLLHAERPPVGSSDGAF